MTYGYAPKEKDYAFGQEEAETLITVRSFRVQL